MDLLQKLGLSSLNAGALSAYWQNQPGTGRLVSFSPINEQKLSEVATASKEDYEHLLNRAEDAFKIWREVPAPKRGDIIRQISLKLREHKEDLGLLVSLEMGKSKQEGEGEVQEMIDIADFAVGLSRMLYGLTMPSERPQHRMFEQWHPYGIVGVISAFNFPVAVWAWNAFISAICGNITIWKPSSKTPLCAIAVLQICNKVLQKNQSPEIFSLFVPESDKVREAFVQDPRVALISFTGSTAMGRKVAAKVAERLGRTILELGGNNGIILDESANLSLALSAILFGAVGTAGQRCTTTRRLFVPESLYEKVTEKLIQAYAKVTIGNPLDEKIIMGPLIDKHALVQFEQAMVRIAADGGHILFGGKTLPGPGYYVQPTLVAGLAAQHELVQAETFAPILYILPYKTLEEAITLHNEVKQGLASAIFTNQLKHAERFLSVLGSDCGIVNVNVGTTGAEIGGAFGGEKDTGGGRESGSDAWKAYMRRQTVTINWGDDLPLAQGIRFVV